MSKNFSKILLAAGLIYLILPFVAMAAGLQLETNFPKAPGMEEVVTGKTQLPAIIRYVVNWSIIIAALAVVAVLVTAGIQYLTSVGRPNAMTAARSRIFNCLIGLAIIAASYLILNLINPQLTIMTIQRKAVEGGGVVMFTQAGLYGSGVTDNCYKINTQNNAPIETEDPADRVGCLNPEGMFGISTSKGDKLEALVKAGAARFLNYDITNTIAEFGKLALESNSAYVTSLNFPLYALGFFGDAAIQAEAKVFAYPDTQFNVVPSEDTAKRVIEYRPGGKMNEGGTDIDFLRKSYSPPSGSPAGELGMTLINIHDDYDKNFKSEVPYFDKTIYEYNPNAGIQESRTVKSHPPLSIRRQSGGMGVILYAENGAMKNLSATVEDFNLSNVKFDNQADKIELRNLDDKGSRIHDFLAILHSGYYFTGDLRLFFEKSADATEPGLQIPLLYTVCLKELRGTLGGKTNFWIPFSVITNFVRWGLNTIVSKCDKDVFYMGEFCTDPSKGCKLGDATTLNDGPYYYYPTGSLKMYGNIPATEVVKDPTSNKVTVTFTKMNISLYDRFGYISPQDKASSLQLFELYRKQGSYSTNVFCSAAGVCNIASTGIDEIKEAEKQGEPVCREVKLCTSKNYMGDCLVYVPNLPSYLKRTFSAPNRFDAYVLPMAPMVPVPIPFKFDDFVKTYDKDGKPAIEKKSTEFENKIKSMSIEGDCVVVLFENPINDEGECFKCIVTQSRVPGGDTDSCKKCWDGGGPGANSEVFTSSVADLTTHEISKCGGRERFGFGERKNCASSIAIFPIKKTNEEQGQ